MLNIYYTAKTGKRNANGHTLTSGNVYVIDGDELRDVGAYRHQSGGVGIEESILSVCAKDGINVGGGYFGNWRSVVRCVEIQ